MAELSLTYRWMTPEDGDGLLRLHRRAILLDAVRAYSPAIAHSWAEGLRPEGYAEAAANGEEIEVAQAWGAVVGFCGIRGERIKGLYVDPAFTGRGIASGLMRRALGRLLARGHGAAKVTAALSGVPFYEAFGFQALQTQLHPTRGGCEMKVVEMALELGGEDAPTAGPSQAAWAMTRLRPVSLAS